MPQTSEGSECPPFAPSRGAVCGCDQRLAKSFGNCKALHQSQRRFLFSAARNSPGGAPSASTLVASRPRRPPPQTFSPRPLPLSTSARAAPPSPGPATPSPTPRNRRAPFRPWRRPSPQPPSPCPVPADCPARRDRRFLDSRAATLQPPGRARRRREARAQARARASRRRVAARAPPSAVGGGAEGAEAAAGREGAGGRRGEPREREPRPAPLQSRANPQPGQQVCVPAAGRGRGFPCHSARVLWPGRGWGPFRVCRVCVRESWDLTTDLHPLWSL